MGKKSLSRRPVTKEQKFDIEKAAGNPEISPSIFSRWNRLSTPARLSLGLFAVSGLGGILYRLSSPRCTDITNSNNAFSNLLSGLECYDETQLQTILHDSDYISEATQGLYKSNNVSSIINKTKIILSPANAHNINLKFSLTQFSYKMADAFLQAQKEHPEATYINFALNHPELSIQITDSHQKNVYNPDTHTLLFDNTMTKEELIKAVLHECWHIYKTLTHTLYKTPPKIYKEKANGPFLGYNGQASDAASRKRALQSAIDKGDNRILNRLPALLRKERTEPNALTEQEKTQLAAAHAYTPVRHQGYLEVVNFNKHRAGIESAIAQGENYKYSYKRNQQTFTLYIDSYQTQSDGSAIISGYTTPNVNTDRATALIGDAREIKFNTAHNYKKYATQQNVFDEFTERDAFIAEFGPDVNNAFYPERVLFHLGEHREFEESLGLEHESIPSYLPRLKS